MAQSKGGADVRRFMEQLPGQFRRVLLGAGRAGGNVIAEDIRDNTQSGDVKAGVKVKVRAKDGVITTRVEAVGKGKYLALWEEYGTAAHEIRVRKAGSLVIDGKFVGATFLHPGARPHPIWRPAMDLKGPAAIAAAQAHLAEKVTKAGIIADGGQEDDE